MADLQIIPFEKANEPGKPTQLQKAAGAVIYDVETALQEALTYTLLRDANIYFYLYKKVSWVRACVDKIAKAAVNEGHKIIPTRRNEYDPIDFYNSERVIALEYILDNINANYDISTFEYLTIQAMEINGTSYARVLKAYGSKGYPVGLEYIDFRTIAPEFDKRGKITRFKVVVNNNYQLTEYINKEDVIMFKLPNPATPTVGLSPLESLDLPVSTDISAQKFNEAFFRNNAQGGMVLAGEDLSPADAERNKEWIQQEYTKPENAHKPMFLLGKIKLVSEGKKTPADMSFIELRQFNRQEICTVYGVPETKLGIHTATNRNSADSNDDSFIQETVEPIQKVFWDTFNREFLKKRFKITDMVVGYGKREKVNIQRTTIANKMVEAGATGNEAREVMGLPAKEGYDTPMFLKSVVPGMTDDQNDEIMQVNIEGMKAKQQSSKEGQQKKPNQTSKE